MHRSYPYSLFNPSWTSDGVYLTLKMIFSKDPGLFSHLSFWALSLEAPVILTTTFCLS